MDNVKLLESAIEYAKKNPDSPQAVQLRRRIESGMYNNELTELKKRSALFQNEQKPKNALTKVASFTGGEELGQGLGQTLANTGKNGNFKVVEKDLQDANEVLTRSLELKKKAQKEGRETSHLDKAIAMQADLIKQMGGNAENVFNPNQLTPKSVVGDALQLGTTVASFGTYGKAAQGATSFALSKSAPSAVKGVTGATSFGKGFVKGAKTGLTGGAAVGASTGVSQGLQEGLTGEEILKKGITGGITGGLTGGVLGGVIGGITGALKGKALRKQILDEQFASGLKTPKGTPSQLAEKATKMAKQQGIDDTDVQFINSMSKTDKSNAKKMIDLAEKATKDKRSIERPIDVVGDNFTKRVKFIQIKNSTAGKAVDTAARALKGKRVDATPVRERALALLEDIGVTANSDGSPNWSKSIFKKTPDLEKKIMKALSDLPTGGIDAYDLHNFKKSIDEVVNYGVKGEGLKGKSANILKAIRASADEVLDSNFKDYNKANTDYKITRDLIDSANDLFGKKVGIVKERGGQLLRSVFSNNTQRPRVLELVKQLDKISKQYGGKFDDNLVDQALFTEILEDIYGTQATTSLQGQVARAVKGTQRVIAGIRDPIKGAGDLLASGSEKALGISPENKKRILKSLLNL